MSFLRGLATGAQDLGPNLGQMLMGRREREQQDRQAQQSRMMQMLGLGLQTPDVDRAALLQSYPGKLPEGSEGMMDIIGLAEPPEPKPEPGKPFTLSPGQKRYDPEGAEIAHLPEPVEAAGQGIDILSWLRTMPEEARMGVIQDLTSGQQDVGSVLYKHAGNAIRLRQQARAKEVVQGKRQSFEKHSTEIRKLDPVEDALKINRQFLTLKGILAPVFSGEDTQIGVRQIAALNSFQRMIDDAVVRSDDVRMIMSAQGLLERMDTYIERLKKGQQFSMAESIEMFETASDMVNAINYAAQQAADGYVDTLDTLPGIYTPDIVGGLRKMTQKFMVNPVTGQYGGVVPTIEYGITSQDKQRLRELEEEARANNWDLPDDKFQEYNDLKAKLERKGNAPR